MVGLELTDLFRRRVDEDRLMEVQEGLEGGNALNVEELLFDELIGDDELGILPEELIDFLLEIGFVYLVIVVADQEHIVAVVSLLIMGVTKVERTIHFHI